MSPSRSFGRLTDPDCDGLPPCRLPASAAASKRYITKSEYVDIWLAAAVFPLVVWPDILLTFMAKSFVFSSESVGEGHPDKVADFISDSVLDACLAQDTKSRVACETLVKSNHVVIAGEITTSAKVNYETVVRDAVREIGYVHDDDVFHADKVFITNLLTKQS